MRTVLFQRVLNYVASLCFGTPDDLQQQHAASLIRYINKEIRTAWEEFPWPELVTVEQRWYRPFWTGLGPDGGGVWPAGSEVYDVTTDAYWLAAINCTSADIPGTSVNWLADTPMDSYVGYAQTGKTPLGEVIAVWNLNPRVFPEAIKRPFWLSDNGVQVGGWNNGCALKTSVWVEYRKQVSQFCSTTWSNVNPYALGAEVYYPTDGNCYLSLVASNTATPGSDATKWQVVPFPYVLGPYVQQAVYAEWLKEDGQIDKATAERAEAEVLLSRALGQMVIQGQQGTYEVRGGSNMRPQNLVPTG